MGIRDKRIAVYDIGTWGWVDDRTHFDGINLWLPTLDATSGEASLALIEMDTFFVGISPTITKRIPLGLETDNVFVSRASKDGKVFVSLLNSGVVLVIDGSNQEILKRVTANEMACGVDLALGTDGIERVFVPNGNAGTVQVIDANTLEIITTTKLELNSPCVATTSPDGSYVWIHDRNGDSSIILDSVTLQTIKRVTTGPNPSMAVYAPDGKTVYIGHAGGPEVVVVESATLNEVNRVDVGPNPIFLSVLPNSNKVYATYTDGTSVSGIGAATMTVISKISLMDGHPFGFYMTAR